MLTSRASKSGYSSYASMVIHYLLSCFSFFFVICCSYVSIYRDILSIGIILVDNFYLFFRKLNIFFFFLKEELHFVCRDVKRPNINSLNIINIRNQYLTFAVLRIYGNSAPCFTNSATASAQGYCCVECYPWIKHGSII